ncbi:MAG: endonuclease/exonuclease/phosphatase family protein [Chitinophagaceae bacterium]
MATKLRFFTKTFFLICNFIVAFFFLLACLAPYMNPQRWWIISFLGLAFPFILLTMLIFLIWWLFIKRKYALISAITLLLGIKSILIFYAFHATWSFHQKKDPGAIRIVTWNVARFIEMKKNNNKGSQTRLKMMEMIKAQDADVICLQEFFHSNNPDWYPNINYIRDNLHYPYYYFSRDHDGYNHYTGSIIFSRYPIIDSGIIRYPKPTLPDALIHADIKINDEVVRVYTTHLQSLQFGKQDYQKIDDIKGGNDSMISNSRTIVSKFKRGVVNRSIQANIIKDEIKDSPYPMVFCGDLNDIPNSYTYATIKGNMQDAFLKKGFGIGRTFSSLSPTLRIDYVFADSRCKILQFNRLMKRYSDHYMLVTDVELKNQ